jgi:osmotically inducible protein OsmC
MHKSIVHNLFMSNTTELLPLTALYTAVATATGDGRNGHTATDDGLLDLDVRVPVAMGGPGGATNPEQLFAAGYAACFHSALKYVAATERTDVSDSRVTARVGIGVLPGGGFGLAVELDLHAPSLSRDDAERLLERAHQVCPYSNATRGNVDVVLTVV